MKTLAVLFLYLSLALACVGVIGFAFDVRALLFIASRFFPVTLTIFIVACVILPATKPRP